MPSQANSTQDNLVPVIKRRSNMPASAKPVPEGFHTVTPAIVVKDAAKAIDFYKKALGAQELVRMPSPDGKIMHAELKIGLHAVGAFQDRHRKDNLRLLPVIFLQHASHQQIEFLVGTAQFHIGFQSDGIITLANGIEQLMNGDGLLFLEALVKLLALQHLRHGKFRRQPDKVLSRHLGKPARVEIDHSLL